MSSRYRKFNIVWDKWNLEHIKKHDVSKYEIEILFKNKDLFVESYKERLIVIGKTKRGRLLTTILSFEKQKDAYIVSARDSSKKERKIYNDKNKTNKTV